MPKVEKENKTKKKRQQKSARWKTQSEATSHLSLFYLFRLRALKAQMEKNSYNFSFLLPLLAMLVNNH